MSKRSRIKLAGLLLFIGIISLILGVRIVAASAPGGNLACSDLTNCTTEASCGGPGTPNECYVVCDNGTTMNCPKKG